MGSTPVILGRKLQCTYHRGQLPDSGACYLEVDVDVASSSVAAHVVGLVQVRHICLCMHLVVLMLMPPRMPPRA